MLLYMFVVSCKDGCLGYVLSEGCCMDRWFFFYSFLLLPRRSTNASSCHVSPHIINQRIFVFMLFLCLILLLVGNNWLFTNTTEFICQWLSFGVHHISMEVSLTLYINGDPWFSYTVKLHAVNGKKNYDKWITGKGQPIENCTVIILGLLDITRIRQIYFSLILDVMSHVGCLPQ